MSAAIATEKKAVTDHSPSPAHTDTSLEGASISSGIAPPTEVRRTIMQAVGSASSALVSAKDNTLGFIAELGDAWLRRKTSEQQPTNETPGKTPAESKSTEPPSGPETDNASSSKNAEDASPVQRPFQKEEENPLLGDDSALSTFSYEVKAETSPEEDLMTEHLATSINLATPSVLPEELVISTMTTCDPTGQFSTSETIVSSFFTDSGLGYSAEEAESIEHED